MKIHSSTSGSGGFDQELSYMFSVQASQIEMFPGPPGEGVCRIHLNQHFCFSVAKSVSGDDSFLARIMTDFLKILSL